MAVVDGAPQLESPTPWLTPDEFAETLQAAIDGDGEALHRLFFGYAAE